MAVYLNDSYRYSFVPAMFHLNVAKACVAEVRHMVTASYLSPELQALHARFVRLQSTPSLISDDVSSAKAKGITILNELGLDPGIDHLLAMRFFDEAKAQGKTIESFVSWCGGLPAPEFSDNPLGYKFSWSPRGVLTAALNAAKFKEDGRLVELPSIMRAARDVSIFRGFNFEGLPNRDSMRYISLYGLNDAELKTMFRGTLRYKGYTEIIRAFHDLGLMNVKPSSVLTSSNGSLFWVRLIEIYVQANVYCLL